MLLELPSYGGFRKWTGFGVKIVGGVEHLLVIAVVAFIIWELVKKGAYPLG